MIRPALLMAAPNGARKMKADHPNLPMTPDELAAEAAACCAAGARAIHIHARDADGAHSLDPAIYAPFLDATRGAVGDAAIVQITTEAVGRYTPSEMIATVRALRPDAVSISVRELFGDDGDVEAARAGGDLLHWAAGEGVGVQHILYDAADLARLRALRDDGYAPRERQAVLFVLGRYAQGLTAQPADLAAFLAAPEADRDLIGEWCVCAFGAAEHLCVMAGLAMGGHGRLGFENNVHLRDGSVADSTAALIRQTAALLSAVDRRPATVEEARGILGCGS